MVDAARPQAALRDLEAAALAEQDVGHRHPHIVENDLGVPVRRVVVAEHAQRPHHLHTRCIQRHQHHRLAPVRFGAWTGEPHHDRDLAAAVHRARRPPFAAVDDVVVAVAPDLGADIGGVSLQPEETAMLPAMTPRTAELAKRAKASNRSPLTICGISDDRTAALAPRRRNPPASTMVAKYGSSASARPNASITIMVSTAPPPIPPSFSENGSPSRPSSAY